MSTLQDLGSVAPAISHEWVLGSMVSFCRNCGAERNRITWLVDGEYQRTPPIGWSQPFVPQICNRRFLR